MKDFALASLLKRILRAKTEGEATTIAADVGADYSDLIFQLVKRLTYRRSLSQNALLHKWYGEIAAHLGDRSMTDVKGECHRKYGLPIRLRDKQFEWVWSQTGAQLSYEKQCKYLASGVLNISSAMNKKELSEYMDAMSADYRAEGYTLTNPEGL